MSRKVVIVGGVAGGAAAAARLRRMDEGAEILLIERGEHVSFANCGLPYHIGGEIEDRGDLLVMTPVSLQAWFNLDVRILTEVVAVDPEKKEVEIRRVTNGEVSRESYDKLVLSPGAKPVVPPLAGIESERIRTLRNMADMDAIMAVVDGGVQRAMVVGGGFIGLEVAEQLRRRYIQVTLVELLDHVMPSVDPEMASPLHATLRDHGVDLHLGTEVVGFEESGDSLQVKLSSGKVVEVDLALVAVGVRPESDLARAAGLEVTQKGAIVVDEHMRTSDPDIYAVGDAVVVRQKQLGTPTWLPLAGPASRQGRVAANHITGKAPDTFTGVVGTSVCRVFDITVGCTGLGEKALKEAGISYLRQYVGPFFVASYFPGAARVTLKILFSPEDGKLLAAQGVGAGGIDKRVDVLATALQAGMTVFDLEDLELGYAPPYGATRDPVNIAGFAAANRLRGDVDAAEWDDLPPADETVILDVRTPEEVETGKVSGSVNIPLGVLRKRLGELPRDREILVYCGVGQRGYYACRILEHHGFKVRNLAGGLMVYSMFNPPDPKSTG